VLNRNFGDRDETRKDSKILLSKIYSLEDTHLFTRKDT